ncbi:MAG: hypothetical protein A2297_09805 [Elusimicrobia bacterium RIFOXYB2_FULL_48_7]|nr:MAG: hypothetical protein A2297_09805 [Elusimicrobia bacterium RIFOXYB2_FULL_48_7]
MNDKPPLKLPPGKIIPAGIILALSLVYWRELLSFKMTVFWEIMHRFMYPFIVYYAQSLKNLQIPLWNPYLSCGTPFLAMLQTQALYPFNLLFAVFSFPAALNIYIIIHSFLAGFFTYTLMRHNGFGSKASILASVIYMFNGFFVYHTEFIHHMSAYVWLPLIFYFFQRLLKNPGLKRAILLSVAFTLQFLAGYPQFSYYTLIIMVAYLVFYLFTGKENTNKTAVVLFSFASLALFCLLSCVQLLPTLELSGLSDRSGGLDYNSALAYSLNINEILSYTFIPLWNMFLTKVYHDAQTTGFYFGILAPLAVITAFTLRKNRLQAGFFLLLAVTGIILSLGDNTPLYKIFLNFLPGMKYFRFPVQCVFFTIFGLTFLAALGLETVKSERLKTVIIAVFVIDLFLFGARTFNLMDSGFYSRQAGPSWLSGQGKPASRPGKPGTGYFRIMMNPLTLDKYKNYIPQDYNDCLNYQDSTIPNFGMLDKLFDAGGYIILRVKNYEEFYSALFRQGYNSPLIGLANIRYMVSDRAINSPKWDLFSKTNSGMHVYENKTTLPRAMFLTKEKAFASGGEVLRYMSSGAFQPAEEIVMLNGTGRINAPKDGKAQITISSYEPGRITIKTANDVPGWLFLSETWYPGWNVYVDGKKSEIVRADYTFRAVFLDSPGATVEHEVVFSYEPLSFKIGAIVSAIAWIAALLFLLL